MNNPEQCPFPVDVDTSEQQHDSEIEHEFESSDPVRWSD